MKIIKSNYKHGELVIKIENLNDLWYLSQVLEPRDIVKGKTERKISIGGKEEKRQIKRVWITLSLEVEKIEFHKYSDVLRVSGKITEGTDDIPHGQYHTINVEPGIILTITKVEWLDYQKKYIKESLENAPEFLLCVLDRDEACFALLTGQGYRILSSFKGEVENKRVKDKKPTHFYGDVIKLIEDYNKRHKVKSIIIASPSFWKEDLLKEIKSPELKQKIIQATCNHTGQQGINEVLKRDELQTALKEDRISHEMVIVEQLLKEISLDKNAAYGMKETIKATNAGAVLTLLVTDELIRETRQKETYAGLANIMKAAQHSGAKIEIIESENPGGKKLDGLGGIGAILRYKL